MGELKEDSVMDTDNVDLAGTHSSGAKSSDQNSEKEQDSASDCYTDDIEEEMEEEVNDDEEYVQPNENKGGKTLREGNSGLLIAYSWLNSGQRSRKIRK